MTMLSIKALERPEFLRMSLKDVLGIFTSDEVALREMEVFDHLMKWLSFDFNNRKPFRDQLIDSLRIGLFSPKDLAKIRQHPLARDSPKYLPIPILHIFDLYDSLLKKVQRFGYGCGRP